MTQSLQSEFEKVPYRVALVLPGAERLLAVRRGGLFQLPLVNVQASFRPAQEITQYLSDEWQVQAVVVEILRSTDEGPHTAIAEVLAWDGSQDHASMTLIGRGASDGTWLPQPVRDGLTKMSERRSSIGYVGWVEEARQWVRASLSDPVIEFDGTTRQLNGGAGFMLLRLGTKAGPAYWVKATGEPNRHEFAITQRLFECCPSSLPSIVAVHEGWNAWAMEEVGTSLDDSVEAGTIALVAQSLARLQQATLGRGQVFAYAGCGDQRVETLRSYLPAFMACGKTLATESSLVAGGEVSIDMVARAEAVIEAALSTAQHLEIPDAINNNDMKLANILFDGTRAAFTDWCHAYWGNPFLTFQHLHTYLSRRLPALGRVFQETYVAEWTALLSEGQISGALTLAPVIAPYAYLSARGPQSLLARSGEPGFRKYFANILRRIVKAGGELRGKEQWVYA